MGSKNLKINLCSIIFIKLSTFSISILAYFYHKVYKNHKKYKKRIKSLSTCCLNLLYNIRYAILYICFNNKKEQIRPSALLHITVYFILNHLSQTANNLQIPATPRTT